MVLKWNRKNVFFVGKCNNDCLCLMKNLKSVWVNSPSHSHSHSHSHRHVGKLLYTLESFQWGKKVEQKNVTVAKLPFFGARLTKLVVRHGLEDSQAFCLWFNQWGDKNIAQIRPCFVEVWVIDKVKITMWNSFATKRLKMMRNCH